VTGFFSKNARPLAAAFFTATLIFNVVGVATANGGTIAENCWKKYCGPAGTTQIITGCITTGCADAHTVNGVLDMTGYLACLDNAIARLKKPMVACPNVTAE
jgi:hypothetical protein